MHSRLRVSLVLPAYNEAASLRQCLEAISRQTVQPYEVIVVDNNSTDDTVSIAKEFPFVRLLHENRQGVLYARARGFDAARGDIIGRIDIDTILPDDWVYNVRKIFADSDVAATSGKMLYYDIAFKNVLSRVELAFRRWYARSFTPTNTVFLQGASMAIRRNAWKSVRNELCERSDIHEDYDIALHLQRLGLKVTFDERLVAIMSARRLDSTFVDLVKYALVNPYTYRIHSAPRYRRMYVAIITFAIVYLPLRLLYRGYNSKTSRFELKRMFGATTSRVNPFFSGE